MPSSGFATSDPLSAMKTQTTGSTDPLGGRQLDPLGANPLGASIPKKTTAHTGNASFDPLSGSKAAAPVKNTVFDPMNPLAGPPSKSNPVQVNKPPAPKFEALLPLPTVYQNRFIEQLC